MDFATLTDTALDQLHIDVLTEQERRATRATAPAHIEHAAERAASAGVDPTTIRAAVEHGLTPKE